MRSFKVLVVDDFEAFRDYVSLILHKTAQFRVVAQASDGLEAVQKAKECQPDVILLDISMPKLNGIEAARQIRMVAPRSKILFLSQSEDPPTVKSALRDGPCGYVLKSDASRELSSGLATVVQGERFLSSGLASAYA